jgi:hypothetical protein
MNFAACPNCRGSIPTNSEFCIVCGLRVRHSENVDCENHSDEPAAGSCVVCGKPVCGDCGVSADGKMYCDQPEHRVFSQEWEVIYCCDSEFEADAVRRNLEDAGFEARLFSSRTHVAMYWFGGRAVVRVFTRGNNSARARELLQNLNFLPETLDGSPSGGT